MLEEGHDGGLVGNVQHGRMACELLVGIVPGINVTHEFELETRREPSNICDEGGRGQDVPLWSVSVHQDNVVLAVPRVLRASVIAE